MTKMFYTAAEAADVLGKSESDLKDLVRAGKLREFRDGDSTNYKVGDVDGLIEANGAAPASGGSGAPAADIVLEPVDDSSIELALSGSDILSLDEVNIDDTSAGTRGGTATGTGTVTATAENEGSSIPSVGVNVFDDDDLDEDVDPLAQTAVTDLAGMGLDGSGSGSGIMDLARESDDTSLGQELLDEIYTDDAQSTADMGDDTRAGLDDAAPSDAPEAEEQTLEESSDVPLSAAVGRAMATEAPPDAISTGLTAAMVVAVAVLWVGGLGAVALVQGTTPALLQWIHTNMIVFVGGALGITVIAAGVSFFLAKRSG